MPTNTTTRAITLYKLYMSLILLVSIHQRNLTDALLSLQGLVMR